MGNPVTLATNQKVDVIASVLPAGAAFPGPVSYNLDNASLGTLVPLASDPNSVTFIATQGGPGGVGNLNATCASLSDTVVITVTPIAPPATSLVLTPGTPVNQ